MVQRLLMQVLQVLRILYKSRTYFLLRLLEILALLHNKLHLTAELLQYLIFQQMLLAISLPPVRKL